MSIICSFIPSIFLVFTSHKSWVKTADLTQTQRMDRLNTACLCIICMHLNCIVCAAVQPNRPEFIFVHRSTEMSFLSVKADARSKKHICSSVTPTSLLNVS